MVVVDYIKWSEEYMENAEIIKSNIDKIQERIKNAPPEKKVLFMSFWENTEPYITKVLKQRNFEKQKCGEWNKMPNNVIHIKDDNADAVFFDYYCANSGGVSCGKDKMKKSCKKQ